MKESSLTNKVARLCSGEETRAYEWFGVHKEDENFVFRVWAPNADEVYLVGSFNEWKKTCPMTNAGGLWTVTLPPSTVADGDIYKYLIVSGQREMYRSDPYSFKMDVPPHCASVVTDIEGYKWHDGGWMAQRREAATVPIYSQPLNIYEILAIIPRFLIERGVILIALPF